MTSAQTTALEIEGAASRRERAMARRRWNRAIGLALVWALVLGNAVVITWLWAKGEGNLNLTP